MSKKTEKADPVEKALAASLELIRKKYGVGAAVIPGPKDAMSEVKAVVPGGIDVVDNYVLALGGFALGRATEMFSAEGGGKTSYSWTVMGGFQRLGGPVIYVDDERSF